MKWSPEIERLWRTKYGYLAFVQTERDGELRMLRSVRDANGNRRQRPAGARKHVGVRRSCNAPDTIGILLKVSLRLCPSHSIRISLSLSFFSHSIPRFFFFTLYFSPVSQPACDPRSGSRPTRGSAFFGFGPVSPHPTSRPIASLSVAILERFFVPLPTPFLVVAVRVENARLRSERFVRTIFK